MEKTGAFAFCLGVPGKTGLGPASQVQQNTGLKPDCRHPGQQLRFRMDTRVPGRGVRSAESPPSPAQAGPQTSSPRQNAEVDESK